MKLLMELNQEIHYLTEEKEGKKNLFIEGIFMQSVPNKNGRIYPEKTLHKEVQRYINEKVNNKTAYGELNHPQGPSINLERVSHIIESLKIDGKNVIGKARIVDENPCGKIVKGLMEAGANLGVSSRGLGSLKSTSNGLMEVQEDFKLVTAADIVADPSAPDAFVTGIMENTEYYYDIAKGTWVEQYVEPMKKSISNMNSKTREQSMYRLFEFYLDGLSKKR